MRLLSLSQLSIQPRTSLSKFGGDLIHLFIRLLSSAAAAASSSWDALSTYFFISELTLLDPAPIASRRNFWRKQTWALTEWYAYSSPKNVSAPIINGTPVFVQLRFVNYIFAIFNEWRKSTEELQPNCSILHVSKKCRIWSALAYVENHRFNENHNDMDGCIVRNKCETIVWAIYTNMEEL